VVLVEFRSANSEGSGRKKEEDRIAIKPRSAKCVGRPNNLRQVPRAEIKLFQTDVDEG